MFIQELTANNPNQSSINQSSEIIQEKEEKEEMFFLI